MKQDVPKLLDRNHKGTKSWKEEDTNKPHSKARDNTKGSASQWMNDTTRLCRLIALTPAGLTDPSIAIAASRAGGLGVLDLEYTRDEQVAKAAIAKLASYTSTVCGIKLDGRADQFVTSVTSDLPAQVEVVILTPAYSGEFRQQIQLLRHRKLTILLETTCLEQALLAEEVGIDGLIAKGHEAGGWVGEETTFILLQRLLAGTSLPIWAQGGIGLHTVGACVAAGAAGVVLDAQLALTYESPLPERVKACIARMDGSESICIGREVEGLYRVYARPDLPAVEELRRLAMTLAEEPCPHSAGLAAWRQAVQRRVGWDRPEQHLWPLGQDAAFAPSLAQRYRTVGGVLEALRHAVGTHLHAARTLRPLHPGGPLASSHGTRYPIVQGPMTRVSDRAEFALRVAAGGALPFLALALMRGPEVATLLEETGRLCHDRPWGVGILGFVPHHLRQEQLDIIRQYRPPFALIAGGRPDQARALEQEGIPTYLHVPSPGLLRLFLQAGARRFVFEGRECGGHVGPRSSFVLWNTMVEVLLEELPVEAADCHILFAGGIHDALSASMVATVGAPLAERGVRLGVLLGTAYLFTHEAVASGAIQPGFQEEALHCQGTVLLETGPGHAIRCVSTPYAEEFTQEKQRLLREERAAEEIRLTLENMNLGRLRIASKGITRHPRYGQEPQVPEFMTCSEAEQRQQGMYMIGQLAALHDRIWTIDELHHAVAIHSAQRLEDLAMPAQAVHAALPAAQPAQVAIVGMSCILPKAQGLHACWENILHKVNAITEIPKERWDWELYYDSDRRARDKIYSKWGGFLDDVSFDPLEYGLPPSSLQSIDPMQLLALKAAREALQDAGYLARSFDRSRAAVILGASGGTGDLGAAYLLRSSLPLLFGKAASDILAHTDGLLPEWTEDSFAGLLLNVAAGRIANRFDLGGVNYIVDAACASSLAALYLAVRELETQQADMVLMGGVDTVQNPFGYLCFSKTQALSPTGEPRTFDANADGIAISEGIVMFVLKRLADAERDGDRIYAVIQGVSGSSDGKAKGLTAPRPEGQMLALQRAYAKAGISPTTVGLFEAHGTGTVVGDRTEALSLSTFLEEAGAQPQSCAIGSIKSMLGHTKATAGGAGLMKVALALFHQVLPPTLGVTQPNPKARFGEGPLYVNTETRPWLHSTPQYPRRAGVSAFGFGGTNFHAVVEEYRGNFLPRPAVIQQWPSELLLWSASSHQDLLTALTSLQQALDGGARPTLRDLAYTLWQVAAERPVTANGSDLRLAIVASSVADLQQKLTQVREALEAGQVTQIRDPKGVYFTEAPLARVGKVVFLFPGQGSQYPNMLRDLAVHFPQVREVFERTDGVLAQHYPQPLSRYIFPSPVFSPQEEQAQQHALTQTNVAQPALGAADMALFRLLQSLGVQPDCVAGHSYGEYVALCAAGVFRAGEETLAILSEARGRCIIEAAQQDLGTMAAVHARPEATAEALDGLAEVWISNLNAPAQTIISGTRAGVQHAVERFKARGIPVRAMPVACAFHSPIVAAAQELLAQVLSTCEFAEPQIEVFANTTAAPYPHDPQGIAALLARHLVEPVQFAQEVEAMYDAGGRIFVEVGPRNVLTGLVQQNLGERPHIALALDAPGRPGLTQLQHALGYLAAHGVSVRLEPLFQGRMLQRLRLEALVEDTKEQPISPTTWLVNGGRARPLHQPASTGTHPIPFSSVAHAAGSNGKAAPLTPAPIPLAEPSSPVQGPDSTSVAQSPASPSMSLAMLPPTPVTSQGADLAAQSGSAVDHIMVQFHQLMNQFLETQRDVMLTYLQGTPGSTMQPGEAWPREMAPEGQTALQFTTALFQPDVSPALNGPSTSAEPASLPALVAVAADASGPASPDTTIALPDKAQLTQQFLHIISERTGYPPQMLDLDVDIEAELGIDSIKRVEVLGALQHVCLPREHQLSQEAMEQLTGIKTLRGIVDWFSNVLAPFGAAGTTDVTATESPEVIGSVPQGAGSPRGAAPEPNREPKLLRSTLVAVDATPIRKITLQFTPESLFLITDDERGIAQAVAEHIRSHGGRVVLARLAREIGMIEQGSYHADLRNPDAVAELVAMIRQQHGPICGLVHLLPLWDNIGVDAMALATWRDRLRCDVKSLFYLAKAAARDIKQAGDMTGAWLLAATAMGGASTTDTAEQQSCLLGQGGLAGLVKSLALEWPTVQCKVVDLALQNATSTLAEQIFWEMTAGDGQVEVRYRDLCRQILQTKLMPLDQGKPMHLSIGADWVVLVTGGSRGITAEVACELAERYRPTLLLVGRSPWPEEESPLTVGITTPRELKAALLEQMRQAGESVSLARVEAAYNRLLQDREMRCNMVRMQQAGATVQYYQAHVYDEQAMGHLMAEIYRKYGRLDGVIHGAGIIEDKLIEEKMPDSFDRVFDTKADSAFILSRVLHADSLKFLVLFSSVAGTFGNRGQGDYAAANAVLNKLAVHLDQNWPGRVVSISWGPWAKAGMVSPELQREFTKRGVEVISIPAGRRMFADELQYGQKGEAEVIVAGGTWGAPSTVGKVVASTTLPLLGRATFSNGSGSSIEVIHTLDPSYDIYLRDHQLDGKPVLPMAMAMELMAEVVQHSWPDLEVVGLRDLHLLRGVILDNGSKTLRLVARAQPEPPHERLGIDVHVEITDPEKPGRPYYRAVVELASRLPEPPVYQSSAADHLHPFPVTVDEIYHQWLFQGPCFQGITAIQGFSDHGMVATCAPSSPRQCLTEVTNDQWLVDPVVFDSGLQLTILWARVHHDMTPLPTRFQRYRRFGLLTGPVLRCHLQAHTTSGGHVLHAHLFFVGQDERLLGVVEEVQLMSSKALNRLASGTLYNA